MTPENLFRFTAGDEDAVTVSAPAEPSSTTAPSDAPTIDDGNSVAAVETVMAEPVPDAAQPRPQPADAAVRQGSIVQMLAGAAVRAATAIRRWGDVRFWEGAGHFWEGLALVPALLEALGTRNVGSDGTLLLPSAIVPRIGCESHRLGQSFIARQAQTTIVMSAGSTDKHGITRAC